MHGRITTVLLLALAGCRPELPESPTSARIRCAADQPCPDGLQCNPNAARCVPEGVDTTPPAIEPGSAELHYEPPAGCPSATVSALGLAGSRRSSSSSPTPCCGGTGTAAAGM